MIADVDEEEDHSSSLGNETDSIDLSDNSDKSGKELEYLAKEKLDMTISCHNAHDEDSQASQCQHQFKIQTL